MWVARKFKKDFVIMNQISRHTAKTSVEKDFYKLVNNSNFGYDCRNNPGNCSFTGLFDEIKELTFAKKYQNVFNRNISEFVSSELLNRQIEEEFTNKLAALDRQDEYYLARKII